MMMSHKQHVQVLLERVRSYAERHNLSQYRLALESGLHPNTLAGKLYSTRWEPSHTTLEKLEALLAKEECD